uniref:Uncharacterized protein n=1 Tax=Timema bartmani TaxID=61472 RepID=A0A7R9FF09_9NEOP|nr:unnamed protein product [Timema bartmani]
MANTSSSQPADVSVPGWETWTGSLLSAGICLCHRQRNTSHTAHILSTGNKNRIYDACATDVFPERFGKMRVLYLARYNNIKFDPST